MQLGKIIVVKNLGAQILIGEPGKEDNMIITIPHKKLVEFTNSEQKRIRLPYSQAKSANLESSTFYCKAPKSETIYKGENIKILLPPGMKDGKYVAISCTNPKIYPGIKPQICPVDAKGYVDIVNEDRPMKLTKHEHFANIDPCTDISIKDMKTNYEHEIQS